MQGRSVSNDSIPDIRRMSASQHSLQNAGSVWWQMCQRQQWIFGHNFFQERRKLRNNLSPLGQLYNVVTKEAIGKTEVANKGGSLFNLKLAIGGISCVIWDIQMVIKKKLKYWKVHSQWVPWMPTDHRKDEWMRLHLNHLQCYKAVSD